MEAAAVRPVFLLILDISGYTEFMMSTSQALEHGQALITELIEAIIQKIEAPFRVSKLEGDAIFLYAAKDTEQWEEAKRNIGENLIQFLEVFLEKRMEMASAVTCKCWCGACENVGQLKLKIIGHSGEALFYKIADFYELAGIDVIIAHRLLKNSIEAHQYILLTEQGFRDAVLPENIKVIKSEEHYPVIGTLKTFVFFPTVQGN